MVDYLANVFSQKDHFHLAITPEGTRSATDNWKTGFYRIALAANVPIQLAAIDFQRKEVGIFELFEPTGNQEEDIAYIRSKYSSEQALFPENFIEYRPLKKRFSIQSISHPLRKAQRRIKYIQRRYQHRYGRTKSFTNKVSHLNNYSGWRKRRSLNQVPKNRKTRALYLSLKRFKSKNE